MTKHSQTLNSAIVTFGIAVFLCSFPSSASAKSRRPISDNEIREKKNACYADIESGLWGWQCKSSMIAKENCALRCLSPACYEIIYESDPLEEGEKDYIRSQEYKYCMHKMTLGRLRIFFSTEGRRIEFVEYQKLSAESDENKYW